MDHYKIDLYDDDQLASFTTQVGDVLILDVPDSEGNTSRGNYKVTAVDLQDAGKHPETRVHLTRVSLSLNAI